MNLLVRVFSRLFGPRLETRFVSTISLIVTIALMSLLVVVATQLQQLQAASTMGLARLLARLSLSTYPRIPLASVDLPEEVLQLSTSGPLGEVHVLSVGQTQPRVLGSSEGPTRPGAAATSRGDLRIYTIPASDGRRIARVAFSEAALSRQAWSVVGAVATVGTAILISCFFLGHFLARTLLNPLERFTESMGRLKDGNLQPILVPEAPQNFGQFQDAFNVFLEQLRRNQEMERALLAQDKMATVGRLAAAVAHETRNPLAAISSLTQILADELRERPRLKEYTRVILKEVTRLDSNIAHLLEYARPMQPHFEPCELIPLVRDVVVLLRFESRRRGIRLEMTLPEEGGESPLLDGNQIKQILVNLVTNSLGVCEVGGRIEVGAEFDAESGTTLWVLDDGPGIPEDIREKVFQPFFSQRRGGTGLGLAVAKRIVDSHCGRIWAEPGVEGKGTRFVVEVPHMEAPPEVAEVAPTGPSPWPRRG